MASEAEPLNDLTCFHCQQSAEKYLKALIEEIGAVIPKTHSLERLLDIVVVQHRALKAVRRGVRFLTKFAVDTRYPGENATKRQSEAALRWADRLRLLGLTTP